MQHGNVSSSRSRQAPSGSKRSLRRSRCVRLLTRCSLLVLCAATACAADRGRPAALSRSQLEADWLSAAESATRFAGARTTQSDAAGGCDGIKDGTWGFHTGSDKLPWWQVDLQQVHALRKVVIWNRCDGSTARARDLSLLLSNDGKQWRTVYNHDGSTVGGTRDKKPLVVAVSDSARYLRVQLRTAGYMHLDEVEVFGADSKTNLALHRPANQSSTSQWSRNHLRRAQPDWAVVTGETRQQMAALNAQEPALPREGGPASQADYLAARTALRNALFADPLLDFRDLLFVKRAPGTFSHMSDQYYGWWSRPGGGLYVLQDWKSTNARLRELTASFPPGSFLKPELSFDGRRVLFSYCRFREGVREHQDKTDKQSLPEDAFYHVFEMAVNGKEVRQITRGRYDDFNARYLPNGEIVFLSTRRGTFLQSGNCAATTLDTDAMPDSYVRCGGGNWRPVAVYTLHVMDAEGRNIRAISPFENFEWDPVVANDGRVIYARWDYVDRDNMPYMSLWSTNPDGTNPQLVYGNHTKSPYGIFEVRPIPNSRKFVFTASAHHSISGGSLCLLDCDQGNELERPLTRLTPEVSFPEIEGWSPTWYGTPFPLSEKLFLTAWSPRPLRHEGQPANETNALGLYVYHASGARELIYRDPDISSCDPIPVRPRSRPPQISGEIAWDRAQTGAYMIADIYAGLTGVARRSVKAVRVIGVPPKVQPQKDSPQIGLTADDPGKFILGTAPVEQDGSAYFQVPSGVNLFFQALDERGFAVQTMRTVSYVQPGQTLSCVGCHEHRGTAPQNHNAMASRRAPSHLTPGPDGTWPFRFDQLVLPVLAAKCVQCHDGTPTQRPASFDLKPDHAYKSLANYGKPSLRQQVSKQYFEGKSVAGETGSRTSVLLAYLERDERHRPMLETAEFARVAIWLDLYGQRLGSFSDAQERDIAALRKKLAPILQSP